MFCECGCGEKAPLATRNRNKRGYIKGKPVRFIRGHYAKLNPPFKGKKLKTEHCAKISAANKGKTTSQKTRAKLSKASLGRKLSLEHRINLSIAMIGMNIGEKNPSWKGGISFESYCPVFKDKEWREIIYERDKDKFCWNPFCFGKSNRKVLHHIDYDKKNCIPFNILKICNSCNTTANFNRDWWQSYYIAIQEKRGLLR